MNRLLYILPILLLVFGQHSYQDVTASSSDVLWAEENFSASTFDILKVQSHKNDLDSLDSLETFKKFAENYSPTRHPNLGMQN